MGFPPCERHFVGIYIRILVNRLCHLYYWIGSLTVPDDVGLLLCVFDDECQRRILADVRSRSELEHCLLRISPVLIFLFRFT